MRQLSRLLSLSVCLSLAACSAPQEEPTLANKQESEAANEQADEPAVGSKGSDTATTLTRVTINGKDVDPKELPPEIQQQLMALSSRAKSAEEQTADAKDAFLTQDHTPTGAAVVDGKTKDSFAALMRAAAEKQGKSAGERIAISDQDLPDDVKRQLNEAMAKARSDEGKAAKRRVNSMFPTQHLTLLDGARLNLLGKPSVITIWASWCKPCIEEMPLFERLAAERSELQVAAINVDFSRDEMDEVLAKQTFKLPMAYDDGLTLHKALGVNTLPLTLVLDADGVIRHQHIGSESTYEGLLSALNLQIGDTAPIAP